MSGIDNKTKLILHCNGTDGSTSFPDSSFSPHTVTANGNAQVDTAESVFGGASAIFDGAVGTYCSIPSSSDFDFGTGDFTIDWWEYRVTGNGGASIARAPNMAFTGFVVGYDANKIYMSSNNSSWDIASGKTLGTQSLSTWTHYAVVRNGTTFYTFKNGVQSDTWTSALGIATTTNPFSIGAFDTAGSSRYLNGQIDELRVSKDIARWTSNFTPPIVEYDYIKGIFPLFRPVIS